LRQLPSAAASLVGRWTHHGAVQRIRSHQRALFNAPNPCYFAVFAVSAANYQRRVVSPPQESWSSDDFTILKTARKGWLWTTLAVGVRCKHSIIKKFVNPSINAW
jgi:hypothetical protein